MIYLKDNLCDYCGTCVAVCPVDCIDLYEAELSIQHNVCIDCELCVDICPLVAFEVLDEG